MARLSFGPLSVRTKLLAIALSPILVAMPVLVGLLLYWANAYYDRLLIYKISSDLALANQYFERVLSDFGQRLTAVADSARLERALPDPEKAAELLREEARRGRFDFLYLLDSRGRVVVGSNPTGTGEHAFWPVVQRALAGGNATGIDVYLPEQLAAIDPRLAERARVAVIETRNAAQDLKTEERRGLVIHSSAPIRDATGEVIGVLEGGMLLNRNLAFVDRINEIVYGEGSLPLGSRGTTTLFLDDVRVATNVRMFENERAIGTRVSLAVRDKVLGEGKTWLDEAFVVSDWYVSGYQPLRDSFDRRVGMLYVGYLLEPFTRAKEAALAAMIALLGGLTLFAALLFLRWVRRILAPLERMNSTMTSVEEGQSGARVGAVASRDEIGDLARHFDRLLDSLQAKSEELAQLNAALDRKVAERTRQLEEAQKQLVTSEKLAAIGQLTAGVAHEINNPTAVIQGNLDVAREVLGPHAGPVETELRLIDDQVNRIRLIVAKLLQFARPDDFAGYVEDVDVNATILDTLVLVRAALAKGRFHVVQQLAATNRVRISRNELQQVLVNLAMNAIQAMPEGGTLTLGTTDTEGGVAILVSDTGIGIPPEQRSRIFDPFFTTKKREGTGLGLSITHTIVERYGGRIEVESEPGRGSTFRVSLPR